MAGKPTYEELEQRVTELEKESFKRNLVEEAQKCEIGQLKALLDGLSSTNIGVDIVSIDYEVLQQNQFLADRFGNIVGKKCHKEYMALEEPCDFCPMIKSLRNKRLEWVELWASDGRNYELLSAPLTNPDGTVDRAIEVVLDITERRQSERELLFKEDIIKSSSSIIATCNLEGKMTFGNQSFLQTWGFDDVREFVGRHFSEFWEVKDRLDEIMHALQTEGKWFGEIQARRKDGTLFDVQVLAATVFNAEGMPIGLTSTSIDISERKQTEEALRESEEKYRSLFDEALDMIHIVDENGKIIDANNIEIERMEYTREEYLGKQLLEMIHPNHRSDTKTKLENVQKGEKIKAYKTAMITKKGEKIDVEVTAVSQIKDGKIIAARAISRDITERERTEEKLEILSSAIEQSYNSIAVFDLEGKTEYANLKLREAYSLSPEEAIGENWRSFIPEHSTLVEDFQEIADIVFGKGMLWKGEISERTKKGEEIWREATIFPIRNKKGEIVHATYITEDITKRKQAEETLRNEEEFTKIALDSQLDTFFLFEPATGKTILWNRAFNDITGYSDEEIAGMVAPDSYYRPEDLERADICIQEALEKGIGTIELGLICKDGRKVPTEYKVSLIKNQEGRPEYFISIGRDITERKQAEEVIRENEKFLSAIFNSIQDGISVLDKELRIISVNQAMQGWYAHMLPLEGKRCFEAYHNRNGACEICPSLRALESGSLEMDEIPLVQADGVTGTLELFAFPMLDGSGNPTGVVEYVRDITERKKAEEELEKHRDQLTRVNAELKNQAYNLEETNAALKVLLRQRDRDKKELEEKVVSNVKEMISPYVEKLKTQQLDERQMVYVNIIESHLSDVISPFIHQLSSKFSGLTPSEIKVAGFVKDGKTTKEIAELLNLSIAAVNFHRNNLRQKLGLRNKKTNLRSRLLSLD
jgi:PAS domain S-box-containing protein